MSERHGDQPSRRDSMLAELTSIMRAHHRRRAVRRGAAAALLIAAAAAWALAGRDAAPTRGPLAGEAPGGAASEQGIVLVAASPRTRRIRIIGDVELVRRLAEIGRPSGLIREGDSARLTEPVISQ